MNTLSVSMGLPFWVFHINGIMQYVVACVWLLSLRVVFSRFVDVVICVHTLFLFMAEYYSIEWLYHSCLPLHPGLLRVRAVLRGRGLEQSQEAGPRLRGAGRAA